MNRTAAAADWKSLMVSTPISVLTFCCLLAVAAQVHIMKKRFKKVTGYLEERVIYLNNIVSMMQRQAMKGLGSPIAVQTFVSPFDDSHSSNSNGQMERQLQLTAPTTIKGSTLWKTLQGSFRTSPAQTSIRMPSNPPPPTPNPRSETAPRLPTTSRMHQSLPAASKRAFRSPEQPINGESGGELGDRRGSTGSYLYPTGQVFHVPITPPTNRRPGRGDNFNEDNSENIYETMNRDREACQYERLSTDRSKTESVYSQLSTGDVI